MSYPMTLDFGSFNKNILQPLELKNLNNTEIENNSSIENINN